MEAKGILQAIGMEATVLAFLFSIVFAAVRITLAERRAQAHNDENYATIRTDRQLF